jgi:hypothetical protein
MSVSEELELTEGDWARVFVDHDNSCPRVSWRGGKKPCNCPATEVYRKLRAAVYVGEFARELQVDGLHAIRSVLAAYRSQEAHVTGEQIQAGWREFERVRELLRQVAAQDRSAA